AEAEVTRRGSIAHGLARCLGFTGASNKVLSRAFSQLLETDLRRASRGPLKKPWSSLLQSQLESFSQSCCCCCYSCLQQPLSWLESYIHCDTIGEMIPLLLSYMT
ncbi:mCG1045696, partial [Mus musculus]